MAQRHRPIHVNDPERTAIITGLGDTSAVQRFHQQLPSYAQTPLIPLDDVATQLGVKSVFLKDESNRLGLPSFKILGASWGTIRAITSKFGMPIDTPLAEVAAKAQQQSVVLFTASEGNHGRAIAAMAKMLGVRAHVFVSHTVHQDVVQLIASEGAEVTVSKLDYDGAMAEAYDASRAVDGGIFVQDTSFEGYTEIPSWIVDGYSTLLVEIDQHLAAQGLKPTLVVTPVGVGSLAHAVVRHCKSRDRQYRVMSVEPDTAACLHESLKSGALRTVRTTQTIMEGLNCGTPSLTAFNDLQSGVDASATVSDWEAHRAVQYLAGKGIRSGPCGAATLAALWRLAEMPRPEWLGDDSTVVILNTERTRTYDTPLDVTVDDPVKLTQILTRIDSSNPDLSAAAGSSETAIARYITAWLQHRGLESHWIERTPGRPSVVGVLRGSGGGKSIMLNGHTDTVSLQSYSSDADPLSGELRETDDGGRVYGRGCLDMKSGLAAAMSAMASLAAGPSLRGDVILAAVADEENFSKGTEDVLAAGWKADAAIITEPTLQEIVTSHKGFVWVEIDVVGRAMHGSLPEEGVDAILLSGALQIALLEYARTMPSHDRLGQASLHGGIIKGGEEPSSYAALCTLTVEFRTVPPQTPESILAEMEELLVRVASQTPGFRYNPPRISFARPASALENDHLFVQLFSSAVATTLGNAPEPAAMSFWCDAGLLNDAGIPTVVYGPNGTGLHAAEEWVSVKSIKEVTSVVETAIKSFCF